MTFVSSYREVREIDREFTWFDRIELLVLESNNLLIAALKHKDKNSTLNTLCRTLIT